MSDILAPMRASGHEQVAFCHDRATGLRAIIAVHDTRLGPGLGGIRIRAYPDEQAAVTDALRLSQAMSLKNACAGLDFGGAKAVIPAPLPADRRAAFLAMGGFVESLGGRYVATEDMGMSEPDIAVLNEVTQHAVGRARAAGGSGDPSPHTAAGVFAGMGAALRAAGLGGFDGLAVAVQGCGKVGLGLIEHLIGAGARVCAADPEAANAERAEKLGARLVDPGAVLFEAVDVVAPCAVGAVLNAESIPRLRCKAIAGGANNQLERDADADALAARGIAYAPDFVINAGGVINVAEERAPGGYDAKRVAERVAALEQKLDAIFAEAAATGRTSNEVALAQARRRIEGR